jgi:hypothetical protein
MCKDGTVRGLAIKTEILRNHCSNRHRHPDETILVYPQPDNIEPGKTTSRSSPRPSVTTTAFSHPAEGPNPSFWLYASKVILLVVQIRRYVVAKEGEERGYCKSFVAVADDLVVDGLPVEPKGEERGYGVDRYHEENSNDTIDNINQYSYQVFEGVNLLPLLIRLGVIRRMHPY